MKLRRSPSSAHTWTHCTAQPHYLKQLFHLLPEDQSSEYSREGDDAHQVAENLFREDPSEYKVANLKKEMITHAQGFKDYCFGLAKGTNRWWSERKVKLFYDPTSNGKIDFSARPAEDELVIGDLKYGVGVAVSAIENLQMAIYAVSLIEEDAPDFSIYGTVTMAIYQPRVRQGEPITTWTLTYGELLQFVEERIVAKVKDIDAKRLKFDSSEEACRFCPLKAICGFDTTKVLNKATGKFEEVDIRPKFAYSGKRRNEELLDDTPLAPVRKGLPARLMKPEELEQDVLTKLVLKEKEITKFLKDVKEYAESLLTQGKPVAGLKLVQGKGGHRNWRNEDEAKEILLAHLDREQVITEKLITPAQADQYEHDLPKEDWAAIKSLTHKPEGGPVIAAENDPRPVYGMAKAADYFEDETAEADWI